MVYAMGSSVPGVSRVAQKVQTLLVDGSEAEGTVRFGLDGASYEIDLSGARGGAPQFMISLSPHQPGPGTRGNQRTQPRTGHLSLNRQKDVAMGGLLAVKG